MSSAGGWGWGFGFGGGAYECNGQVDPLAVDDAVGHAAHRRHQPGVFLADLGEQLGLREGAAVVLGAGTAGAGEAGAVRGGVEALGLGEDAGAGAGGFGGGFGGGFAGGFGGCEAAGEGGGGEGGAPEGAGLRQEEPREGEGGRHFGSRVGG